MMFLCACLASPAAAQPVAVEVHPNQIVWYRATLVGYSSAWVTAPSQVSMNIAAPAGAGPVTIRDLRIACSLVVSAPGVPQSGGINVTTTNLVLVAAGGQGFPMAAHAGGPGEVLFAAPSVPTAAQGAANYSAAGLGCVTLSSAGAPCQGPFNLALPTPSSSIASGIIAGATTSKTVSLTFNATLPFVSGATWGSLEVWLPLQASFEGGSTPSPCPADFNLIGGVTVADIFAFLTAWFAGDTRADFNNAGGVTVADIFAFLTAWFAGC